ncbi:hypothetical protein PgNI_06493 [Pyricularia grisea]|uniref:Methyltransferase type 11 domain-containing protein n=1 Tax=Pyricularia grisea TaxID=148305 RepID=A0A6P8B5K1_PYRGI|nr:hypothetical protein PgNI_06493 [Pyricularia grisea]TLD10530.1 hypothetical protein PgNI_06493 [Pyricularia grisea]
MYYWAAASPPFHQGVGSNRKNNNNSRQSPSTLTRDSSSQSSPSSPPQSQPLARSSSTSRAVNRRPLLFGHARTASTDSNTTPQRGGADGEAASGDRERPAHPSRWHHHLHLRRTATSPEAATSTPGSSAKQFTSTESDQSLYYYSSPNWPLPAVDATAPPCVDRHVLATAEPDPDSVSASAPLPNRQLQEPSESSGHSESSSSYQTSELPLTPHLQPANTDSRSANTSATPGSHPVSAVDVVNTISPSIAALAAASGASIPYALASPSKSSFSQRISQHISDRRSQKQQSSTQAPLPSFDQTSSTQARLHSHETNRKNHHAAMPHGTSSKYKLNIIPLTHTTDSLSSASATTSLSSRARMSSTDHHSDAEGSQHRRNVLAQRLFVNRNGRTYIAEPNILYPLPVDLPEINRQSMRTLMMLKLFGRPICSPVFHDRPPVRVLDIGCGSGFWSMKCHQYWSKRGHPNVQFTGLDIVPIGGAGVSSGSNRSSGSSESLDIPPRPDRDMKWRFVRHDLRKTPYPFADNEFDLVMLQSISLTAPQSTGDDLMDEVMRILRPGGVVEFWEADYIVRMLRPHVPTTAVGSGSGKQAADDDSEGSEDDSDEDEDSDDSSSEEDPDRAAASLGAYVMTANTPMSSPLNNYLVEYNSWVTKALEGRSLSPVPCTSINPLLLQEEGLLGIGSKRLAVPLSEVKWEREGVGGVVTKDGKSYVKGLRGEGSGGANNNDSSSTTSAGSKGKALSANQAAVRRTALLTVVQLIQSLEPVLREVSGKSQDEWDGWLGKMMNDLLKENGTSWGECLEVGAWWARKRK